MERGNLEKVTLFIGELRRLGIAVRPPSVNMSGVDFELEPADCTTVSERCQIMGAAELAVRFGLGAIKNVGDAPAEEIVRARGDQAFANVDDFCERVDLRKVNKRVLECLIRAGALDCLGDRADLLASIDQMMATSQQVHHDREIGQGTLFDLADVGGARGGLTLTRARQRLSEKERLADEKDLLGSYLANHPLDVLTRYEDERLTALSAVDVGRDGERLSVAGMIESVRVITTKKGELMAFAQIEDLTGSRELVVFPNAYRDAQELLTDGGIKLIDARVQVRDDDAKLIAEAISTYSVPADAQRRARRGQRRGATGPQGAPAAWPAADTSSEADPPAAWPGAERPAPHATAPRARRLRVELPGRGHAAHARPGAAGVRAAHGPAGEVPLRLAARAQRRGRVDFSRAGHECIACGRAGAVVVAGQGHYTWA